MPQSRRSRKKKSRPIPRATADPRSRRFSEEQRRRALEMIAAGISGVDIASSLGTTTESLRRWWNQAKEQDQLPPPPSPQSATETLTPLPEKASNKAPHDPGQGLGNHEVEAILALKKRHPSMGPAQIRAQLKRFKAWRLSVRAIARVLRRHGYEPAAQNSRQKDFTPQSWEAPWRNAIWQADFVELRIGGERRQLLVLLDDFSRFCVGYRLMEEPTSEAVVEVLREAIRRHGKCEALYTDRGGPFPAWRAASSLAHFLEEQLIDHLLSKPYRPVGRGKIEALIGTLQRELWQVRHFDSVEQAEEELPRFLDHYNHHRAHSWQAARAGRGGGFIVPTSTNSSRVAISLAYQVRKPMGSPSYYHVSGTSPVIPTIVRAYKCHEELWIDRVSWPYAVRLAAMDRLGATAPMPREIVMGVVGGTRGTGSWGVPFCGLQATPEHRGGRHGAFRRRRAPA